MTGRMTGAPRRPVLWGLVTLVLGAHLWLLAGGLPHFSFDAGRSQGSVALSPADPAEPGAAGEHDSPLLRVVTVKPSTVRWILPSAPTVQPPAPRRRVARANGPVAKRPGGTQDTPMETPTPVAVDGKPPQVLVPETPAAAPELVAAAPPATDTPPEPPAMKQTADHAVAAPAETAVREPSPLPANPSLEPTATQEAPATAGTGHALPPARVPGSVTLDYDIHGKAKGLGYSADARLQWQVDGARYTASLDISAFLLGSRVQTSQGRVGPQGLMPERFGDRRRSTEKAAHFDPDGQRIRFSNNAPDAPLLPGAQDRLSVFLQLAALLRARPQSYPEGRHIEIQVVGTGSAEVWRFQVGASQMLSLPAGEVQAVHLQRGPRQDYDSTVDIWLAPGLQHLPVRIRVTEHDGTVADQLLRQLPAGMAPG